MADSPACSNLERIAARIFSRYGVDFSAARRGAGWTNATWLAGGLVLRLSRQAGNDQIRREVRLAALLPPEVGYPLIVESGETEGFEWSLAQEIPGCCLGEVWSGLDGAARSSALRQLWQRAQAVHSVCGAVPAGLARTRSWFNSSDFREAQVVTQRLVQQGLFNDQQGQVLHEGLSRFGAALPGAELVLSHGDMTLDNCMWHDGRVVALLDFEYALMAPLELDLNHLLKNVYGPQDCAGSLNHDRSELDQAGMDIARPVLDHPGGTALLYGYAVLLEQWLLELWLDHPEGEGPLDTWDPYNRLLSLADGQGGYLQAVLSSG